MFVSTEVQKITEPLKQKQTEPLWTPRFIILCFTNFLLFTSFFFLLPTLPVYLVQELQAKEDQVGFLIGIFTLAAVIARPMTGYIMDRFDQKRIFMVAVVLFLLATLGYLWVKAVVFFMLVRFVHGFGFGMATTAGSTMAAEWIPAQRRGEGIGYFGTFVMVAMSLGPVVSVYLVYHFSYPVFFTVCAAFAACGVLLSIFLRPPVKLLANQQKLPADSAENKDALVGAKSTERTKGMKAKLAQLFIQLFEPKAIPAALCTMMIAIVFGGCVTFISLYAIELGDAKMAGVYFSLYAFALVLVRPFAGRWFDSKGPYKIIMIGSVIYFAGVILLGLAQGAALLYLAAVVIGIGYGSLQPSYQALVIKVSPEHRRGAATATFFTTFDIGVGIGAFVLGIVAKWSSYGVMFLFSSLFVLASIVLFYTYWKRGSQREKRDHVRYGQYDSTV